MQSSTSPSAGSARIGPAAEPLDEDVRAAIDRVMRGNPPLALFTTMARDPRLFFKYFDAGLLDRGHLSMRQREIVIDRTTALCGAEYEWGVHVTRFGGHVGLTNTQITSLLRGDARDDCWSEDERVLIDLCDELHHTSTISDHLWARLKDGNTDEAIIELLLLAGFYHTTAFLVNAFALPFESGMARFADYPPPHRGTPDASRGEDPTRSSELGAGQTRL